VSASLSPGRKQLARAFVVACAVLAVFAAPAAAAPPPCWKTLLNDWYDGHIDHTYPLPCYHQAIAHLPRDVQNYSSAKDDILRALATAIADSKPKPTTTTTGQSSTPTTTTTTTTTPKPHKRSPISNAIRKLTPGGADAFPLPLLILGLLALLLIAAGIAGMVWRRFQGRRGTT
jgi:Alphavirus glycoprotein J